MLSDYQWYRKFKRGVWYEVSPKQIPEMVLWVRNPKHYEHIWQMESWYKGVNFAPIFK